MPIQPRKARDASRKCAGALAAAALLFFATQFFAEQGALGQAAPTEPAKTAGAPSHTAATTPPSAQAAIPGAAIFAQHCAQCHGERGQGVSALVSIAGPSLQAEHDPGAVLAAVREGRGVMPGFAAILPAQDIQDVAGYVTRNLATIPLLGGNIGEGGELYRMNCAVCHRTAVRGGALAFLGTNAPALTDKSPAVVAGAIRWGPGPMPNFPKSVLNDQELDSIVQYVGYVQHPANPGGQAMHWYGPVAEGLAAWIFVFMLVGITMWIEKGGKG